LLNPLRLAFDEKDREVWVITIDGQGDLNGNRPQSHAYVRAGDTRQEYDKPEDDGAWHEASPSPSGDGTVFVFTIPQTLAQPFGIDGRP
jgi:hypothetical protein